MAIPYRLKGNASLLGELRLKIEQDVPPRLSALGTELFTKPEILALLEKARVKNARLGVTGILLYRDGNIIQALEGEESAVRGLFQTICEDPRHRGMLAVIQEPIAEREFADWSMAFRDLSLENESDLPGFNQFLNTPLTAHEFSQSPSKVRTLLRVFKKQMR